MVAFTPAGETPLLDSVRQAERAILEYLRAHPDARDTVDGIEKWWLPQSRPYTVADVVIALDKLTALKLLRMWESPSLDQVYGREKDDPQSIEDYLHALD